MRLVGFGLVDSGGVWVQFIDELIHASNSVGIIRVLTPSDQYRGTVFRVGPRHVMTCYHVVKEIHGKKKIGVG